MVRSVIRAVVDVVLVVPPALLETRTPSGSVYMIVGMLVCSLARLRTDARLFLQVRRQDANP